MKRSILILASATPLSMLLLSACDNSGHTPPKPPAEISTTMEPVNSAPASQEIAQPQEKNADLREELATLQASDPTVKDIYYGVDEKGERVLNVVREETNGESASSISSTVWPLLGGMAAGAVIAKMVSSGGVSNYASHYPPARAQSFYSRDDERNYQKQSSNAYRSTSQPQVQQRSGYNNYSNDRNSFQPAKPQPQVVQRTVAPSTGVGSSPQKTSQYYAPTQQAAPSSNNYSRQNTSTSYQPAKISTRIEPAYKTAAAPANKAPAYRAPANKAPAYKAPAFKASSSGSRRR